jgi:hypothetical protein
MTKPAKRPCTSDGRVSAPDEPGAPVFADIWEAITIPRRRLRRCARGHQSAMGFMSRMRVRETSPLPL